MARRYTGEGVRKMTHPSYQVLSCTQYLIDFIRIINDDIRIPPGVATHL